MGKFNDVKGSVLKLYDTYSKETNLNFQQITKEIAKDVGIEWDEYFRVKVGRWLAKAGLRTPQTVKSDNDLENETVTETNQYLPTNELTATKPNGQLMSIDEYCEVYGIPREQVRSFKLVTHTGRSYYNIASANLEEQGYEITYEDLKELLFNDFVNIELKPRVTPFPQDKVIVVTLADLHFGAYVDNLAKTREFSIDILANLLHECAVQTNKHSAKEVHVHILGDLIESFTGLNHINSWKGLQKGMIGAEVVKLCTKVIHDNLLSKIDNLKSVKVISGNHDRVTSNRTEDTDGDAANLIAWGLELIGYNVEYDPFVLTHLVDDINYVLLHGHDSISKKSTKDICWDYGKQGKFNFITEGHLHSIIEKLSVAQQKNFQTIKDDAIDHRRMNCPSLFTGNSFSERLGYTSNSGFIISENNGKGIPNVYFYAL